MTGAVEAGKRVAPAAARAADSPGKSVAVVGVGNVGGAVVPHLGRMAGIGCVILIDEDCYEIGNLVTQEMLPRDVGRAKALVQRARLRSINPAIEVSAIVDRVENVPLGRLRADVILACLDSRQARRVVSHAATRLGVPWIDAGVQGDGLLARVNVLMPGADHACLECAWSADDYDVLERRYRCPAAGASETGEAAEAAGDASVTDRPPPTNAPSGLGSLAAALQILELQKILAQQTERAAIDREVLIDAAWHKHYVTETPRNPRCRFDHRTWRIERLERAAGEIALAEALGLALATATLRHPGLRFTTRLCCPECGRTRGVVQLAARLGAARSRCPGCGGAMAARGFDLTDHLAAADLLPSVLRRPLDRLGFRCGDVFELGGGFGVKHFEISGGGA